MKISTFEEHWRDRAGQRLPRYLFLLPSDALTFRLSSWGNAFSCQSYAFSVRRSAR